MRTCRYLDRIIRSSELHDFSEMLQLHQKALTADGRLVSLYHHSHLHCVSKKHPLVLLAIS